MTRMRSPNYPGIPLKQSIDLVAKIYREDRRNAIEKEDAAKHMGYSGLTGRTLKLLGALSQFGLLEKVGKGQVRVSATAESILHGTDDAERNGALLQAARSPTLFRRIRESFDSPSDRTIMSFLMKEGFTDAAVPPVLRSYNETNAFLAASGVSESHGNDEEDDTESGFDLEEEDPVTDQTPFARTPPPPPAPIVVEEGDGLHLNFDLQSISVRGKTTSPSELLEFVQKLTALQELFEKFAPKEPPSESE